MLVLMYVFNITYIVLKKDDVAF